MKNSVVVVAAHPDDAVLGCGGTIKKITKGFFMPPVKNNKKLN